jgi:ribonuclease G
MMKSELIVDVQPAEVSAALLEDGRLVSLQKEARNIQYSVGDIYLAKVKKLMPGLNAAFVNVGYEKDAFLHYLDLGAHFATYAEFLKQLFADRKRLPKLSQFKPLPDIDKHGSVSEALTPGQELLVQIVKEPISSKGPRLTTEISFTGRYLVLTPFADKISISQKIKSPEEKIRLRQLIDSIKPRNFGVIVRTSAEGKKVAELNHELKSLIQAFEEACAKAQRSQSPALVFEEQNRVVGILRDVFSPSFENIHVNDSDTYDQLRKYVNLIAPDRSDIVKLYQKDAPIFDNFSVTRQIKSSFGKTVSFKSGAYIIIETTEALHVIDVNSGNRSKAGNDQETNALEVNLRAADEIARQLRLRDMGGIIVVDFIDMAKAEHRQELFEHMREVMANDRARHNILPLSKFGLMQITRQRVRPALDVRVNEQCPSCGGKGEVGPSILFTDTLFDKLEYMVKNLGMRDFIMYVHPFVEAYLKKGLFHTIYGSWRSKLGRCFKIMPDESMAYLQYRIVDKDRNEVIVRDEKDEGHSSASKTADKRKRSEEIVSDDADAKSASKTKQTAKQVQKQTDDTAAAATPQTKAKQAQPKAKPAEKQAAAEQKPKQEKKLLKAPADTAASEIQQSVRAENKNLPVVTTKANDENVPAADTDEDLFRELLPASTAESTNDTTSPKDLPVDADDDTEIDSLSETDSQSAASVSEGKSPAKKRRRRRRKPANASEETTATDNTSSQE